MASKRILPMRKDKEILNLKYDANLSYPHLALSVNVSTSTAHDIVSRFNRAALRWQLSAALKMKVILKENLTQNR